MFACVPRHVLLSHNPVIRATKSNPMFLYLNNSSDTSLNYHEPFILHRRMTAGSRTHAFLSLKWPSTVVAQRMSFRGDSVVCRRSGVLFRSSCSECSLQTILCSAVLHAYCYGCPSGVLLRLSFRRTATVVLQAYCYGCPSRVLLRLSFRRTATVVLQAYCYGCPSGVLLRLSFRRTATVVLHAYCYGCPSGVLLQLSFRRTATVVLQAYCYGCHSCVLLQLSFRRTATVVLQAYCYSCPSGVLLRLSFRCTATVVLQAYCYGCPSGVLLRLSRPSSSHQGCRLASGILASPRLRHLLGPSVRCSVISFHTFHTLLLNLTGA